MIHNKCFTIDWITQKANEIGSCNPIMLEKATVALQLVGYLAESGLPFQFKGGTSLLLRLSPIRRLSIDVDIVTQASFEDVMAVLKQLVTQFPFSDYQHDTVRDRDLPPKKHFKVFYPSVIAHNNDHILLDVLFEKEPSPCCDFVPIRTSFIALQRQVLVAVPTANALLGDKLTAFAPKTIGILYAPARKTDIVKQLFDVGVLFDDATDLQETADVYEALYAKQCAYRNASFTLEETLNDTITAGYFSQLDLRGAAASEEGALLQQGVHSLQNHLVNVPFRRDEARIAAGKAACVAACIQRRMSERESIENLRFDLENAHALHGKDIITPWQPLNRLKGGNPEAFHYWYEAQRILREE